MRRRTRSSGFVLAEALVALAVAAMTLALLTGASWGLRQTTARQDAIAETGAADWLTARRALAGWAAGVTAVGKTGTDARFIGTATTARMIVDNGPGDGLPFVAELRIAPVAEAGFALIAARHLGQNDARTTSDQPQQTVVLRSAEPIRLLYLLPREGTGTGFGWRYETGSGDDGLPAAIAIERGDQRMLTTRIFPTVSAGCLAALGPAGLEDDQCTLR